MSGLVLYQFIASPFSAKVRWALEWKRLEFRAVEVSPLTRKEVKAASGQTLVPVLARDGKAVADSSSILAWLDEIAPERPLLPADPAARARALALEDWADEVFLPDQNGFRLVTGCNAARVIEQTLRHHEQTRFAPLLRGIGPSLARAMARKRFLRGRSAGRIRADYERMLDLLDGLAASSPCLCGEEPTVFDASVWGGLWSMRGMDGGELIERRENLSRWWRRLKDEI